MKLTDRGYWVSKTYKWVSLAYWSAYSLYFRTLTYFSAANPKIYLGGMLDERKSDIYSLVPSEYLPKTRMIPRLDATSIQKIAEEFSFPIIVKPNIGYKGYMVKKIDNVSQLEGVIQDYQDVELIIQEFLCDPKEYSVMYFFVNDGDYGVTSLVEKKLPVVMGDGVKSVSLLIEDLNNPFLNKQWIIEKNEDLLSKVLQKGESFVLDHVGNYSRGSKFVNLNAEICSELVESVHNFYRNIRGMNFCRMDVKAASLEDLKEGKFKLLEINGAKSEPLHIYDPSFGFLKVFKSIHDHWIILFRVVKQNINTVEFPSSMEGIRSYFTLKKMVN